MRPTALLSLLAFAACSPAPLADPSEAVSRAAEAAGADARQALRLLRAGAAAGDLDALHELARTYERGYLVAESGSQPGVHFVAVWRWPGSATRARRAYDRALARGVAAGDPGALLRRADQLHSPTFDGGRSVRATAADRARARAIVDSLAEAGAPAAMLRVGFSLLPTDPDSAAVWMARAEAAGSAQGCWIRYHLVDSVQAGMWSARDVLAGIDRAETCRRLETGPSAHDAAGALLASLRQAARTDGPLAAPARQQLDSLRALGLFERHPRLADAGPAEPRPSAADPSTP